ncbi:type II restriction endonuclease [Erwinia sp. OLMDLW33]|nr:type II restriction endonuclease [Erwinia sp. OLMDLW33]
MAKINFSAKNRDDALKSRAKWFPCQKGGGYRKWFGNHDYLVNWENDGRELLDFAASLYGSPTRTIKNMPFYFREGATWSTISSSDFSIRYSPVGFISETKGAICFADNKTTLLSILGFGNSKLVNYFLKSLSPTLDYHEGPVGKLPFKKELSPAVIENVINLISLSEMDWNSEEVSWGFRQHSSVNFNELDTLSDVYEKFINESKKLIEKVQQLEVFNNKEIIHEYGLESELSSYVSFDEITLNVNPDYKYPGESDDKLIRMRSYYFVSLISYSTGCMMGRYSLDREGLVYAHEGNKGFAELVAEGAYKTFPADEDGILPLMDSNWFDDDVTARVKEFVSTVWGEEHLQENLDFIAESLCLYAIKPKKGESSLDTIRRYLSTQFWKEHMKMYKKRPIYWLFSSGKEKAFECLVYLHRYNDATLSRMRTEYVVPLLARYQGNIDLVSDQLKSAESGAATTRLKKELDGLSKKFNELRNFDDRLRHYADMRITIDLDDGVKVNYGKFGDLLADVKAITGSAPEEI